MNLKKSLSFEKIINVLLDIFIFLFGIILLISVYNAIQVKIMGNDYPSFFGYSTFEVQTGSMGDAVRVNDWIIVKANEKIKLNDIVTYEDKGQYITHRVIEVYKDTYTTKGDANNAKDKSISKSQIVGKVVKVLHGFGLIKKTLFNPLVLITLIVTLYLLNSIFKSKNKKEEFKITKLLKKVNKKKETKKVVNEEPKIEQISQTMTMQALTKEDLDNTVYDDDDLNKTICFRAISVDADELEELGEKNIVVEDEEKLNTKKEVKEIDEEQVEEDKLSLIKQMRNKKFNNIIDKIMYLKKQELNEIIDILNMDRRILINEKSIKNSLIESYVDAKYYNYCGDVNSSYSTKNMTLKINKAIKLCGDELIEKYTGTDTKYDVKVKNYVVISNLICNLEQAFLVICDIKTKRKDYSDIILKTTKDELLATTNVINEIIRVQKIYKKTYEYLIEKLESNKFKLNYNQLFSKKNIYAISLNHNISFSKVYSNYAVDKSYEDDEVEESKIMVLLTLLLAKLVSDMFNADFKKKYIVHIPKSIYEKPNKFGKIFKFLDDEEAKNSIVILTEYELFIKNYKVINLLIKNGYRFSISFDENSVVKEKDIKYLYVLENIFINKKQKNKTLICEQLPDDLKDKIIYEDIKGKLNSIGGE